MILVISQFCLLTSDSQRWWLNFEELHLDGALAIEWDLYASRLAHAGVYISEQPDRLV